MSLAQQHDTDLTRWGSRDHGGKPRSDGAALVRLLLILVGLFIAIIVADVARAGSIRLHDEAGATARQVTLGQVAELKGEDAEVLADVVVYTLAEGREHAMLTLQELRSALDAAEVNWARLSLKGFTTCKVTLIPNEKPVIVDTEPVVASNPEVSLDAEQPKGLQQIILQHFAAMLEIGADELQVEFTERDQARLRQASVIGRLEIEPLSRQLLGRTTIRVRRHEGVEVTETMTFSARISRRSMGLVLTEPVRRGQLIAAESLELREVLIDSERVDPMTERALIDGQVAAADLKAGDVLEPRHLRPMVLIKRGESIKVRSLAGGLVVRVSATALEAGGRDDVITVRNQTSRETLSVRVIGPREAVVVGEGESDPASVELARQ